MGDERGSANESESLAATVPDPMASPVASAPRAVAQLPRPVSLPPRPSSAPSAPLSTSPALPLSYTPARPPGTPPPPPVRSVPPLARPGAEPPTPPLRTVPLGTPLLAPNQAPPPAPSSLRPPPPSMRPAAPSVIPSPMLSVGVPAPASLAAAPAPSAPVPRAQELFSDLMRVRKELTEKSTELRKATSERNTLRARLLRAEAAASELSSAFRAEARLRAEFVDAHAASSAALRARVVELEAALATVKSEPKAAEQVGLRRIRGIGPAYERALLGLGITRISQVAALTAEDIARIAPQIKAQPERILRDDWVGQAERLLTEDPQK